MCPLFYYFIWHREIVLQEDGPGTTGPPSPASPSRTSPHSDPFTSAMFRFSICSQTLFRPPFPLFILRIKPPLGAIYIEFLMAF
jgi:hypothetical protein